MKTIFCDIDGTIFYHFGSEEEIAQRPAVLLPGVHDKFWEWLLAGHTIVLTTGRHEGLRSVTVSELLRHNIPYHHLLMQVGHHERVVINDEKPSGYPSAKAIVVKRDKGLEDVVI